MVYEVDEVSLRQLRELRDTWTEDLNRSITESQLLRTEIFKLGLVDPSVPRDEWEAKADRLRPRAGVVDQQILELRTLISSVESNIRQWKRPADLSSRSVYK